MNWKRTKYLANGCFITEELSIGHQKIVLEFVVKNGKPQPIAYYYQDGILMKAFQLQSTSIDMAKVESIHTTINYINQQMVSWSDMLDEWDSE